MLATALDVSDRTNIHLSALDGISDQRRNDSEDEHDWCPVETNKMSVKTQNQKKGAGNVPLSSDWCGVRPERPEEDLKRITNCNCVDGDAPASKAPATSRK